MASIEERDGAYRVRWRNPGERVVRSRKCPSRGVAKRVAAEIEAAAALGRAWPDPSARVDPLLGRLVEAWLVDLARVSRAPRTIARAHATMSVFVPWVAARVGREPTVSDLTIGLVEAWDGERAAKSVATRRTDVWAICAVWAWGYGRDEWRGGMGRPTRPVMPAMPRSRPTAPTWEQMDAVLEQARHGRREWLRRAVTLMRGLGWRITQVIGLSWADVDLDACTISLPGRLGKTAQERAGRTVPMAPWLRDELRSWLPRKGPLVPQPQPRGHIARLVGELWAAAGVPETVWRQRPDHAFRIGLISGLTRARADVEAVEFYVGHAALGVRGHYVDPEALPLGEVAALIRAPGVAVVSEAATAIAPRARR